jgi:hypothetical protein
MPTPRGRRKDGNPQTQIVGTSVAMLSAMADGPTESLVVRIRGEYSEMPGLRLTIVQACRLWQLDASTCGMVLEQLVRESFLRKTIDGAYIALPRGQAKAQLRARAPLPRSA